MAKLLGDQDTRPTLSPLMENHNKMIKIRALSAAIYRARQGDSGSKNSLLIQQLVEQRRALRATMPPVRLVHSAEPLKFKLAAIA
jgi:hypothetical protein